MQTDWTGMHCSNQALAVHHIRRGGGSTEVSCDIPMKLTHKHHNTQPEQTLCRYLQLHCINHRLSSQLYAWHRMHGTEYTVYRVNLRS